MNRYTLFSILSLTAASESCAFLLSPINSPTMYKSSPAVANRCFMKKEEDNTDRIVQDEKDLTFFDTVKKSLQKLPMKINEGEDKVRLVTIASF